MFAFKQPLLGTHPEYYSDPGPLLSSLITALPYKERQKQWSLTRQRQYIKREQG